VAARREAGARVIDLTASNPTAEGIPYPIAAIQAAFADADVVRYEPAPLGLPSAREAVAGYYAAQRGVSVSASDIMLTSSTSEAYALLFKLLADPGDVVAIPAPCYPLFAHVAALESVETRSYPLVYDGRWRLDVAKIEVALTPRTRAIVVVSPSNPTGWTLTGEELAQLNRLAADRDLALISDEVFADYAVAGPVSGGADGAVPVVATRSGGLAFSLSGLSKVCGLPQVKLGWMVVGGPAAVRAEALAKLEVIADAYLSVGTPVMRAAPALLALGAEVRAAIRGRLDENREILGRLLASLPEATLLRSGGGWYAVVRFPQTLDEETLVVKLVEERGVLVYPGYFFDFPGDGYLVVSLLPEPQLFSEGAAAVVEVLTAAVTTG